MTQDTGLLIEIRDILKEIREIENRREQELNMPKVWPGPRLPWTDPDLPGNYIPKCPKCNMDLSGGIGYVCSNHDCPVGELLVEKEKPKTK
jgi:hypothetical protein